MIVPGRPRTRSVLRIVVPGLIVIVAWVMSASAPARADTFEEYQARAADASYTGRQVVASILDGDTEAGLVTVERQGGATVTDTTDGYLITGGGKARGNLSGVELMVWNDSAASSRYTTSAAIPVTRLGQPCDLFEIREGDGLRARIVFDVATAAPISYEVYDGAGKLFRLSAMLDLSTDMPPSMAMMDQPGSEFDVLEPAPPGVFPDLAGGYLRADVYSGRDDTVQAFYTDGLFSYSVFELPGDADPGALEATEKVRIGLHDYRRRLTPGALWVMWNAGDRSYLLVGDLPPDHLDGVLADLPKPLSRGFFGRLWHGLFG